MKILIPYADVLFWGVIVITYALSIGGISFGLIKRHRHKS